MDNYKAQQLAVELTGKTFRKYQISRLLNNGKSAAVFLAADEEGRQVAVKIFDNEMIERYGHQLQQQRIEQEISLKGHTIAGLVCIRDGGQENIAGTVYYFLIMDYVNGQNLKEYIGSTGYPSAFVKKVALTLFHVTEQLLEMGIAHRDIKPENIMIGQDGEILLMDLGVLKFIGTPSSSDVDEKQFVGTLRYAPPEFLTRQEVDNTQGWRAVNYYQTGAVMHDLIMKKELFEGKSPYANVVIAIKEDAPEITAEIFPFETVQLARDLLNKSPHKRLQLVTEARIAAWKAQSEEAVDELDSLLEELHQMTSPHKVRLQQIEDINRSIKEKAAIRLTIANKLTEQIKETFVRLKEIGGCPQWSVWPSFQFSSDAHEKENWEIRNQVFDISGALADGFSQSIYILIRSLSNERSEAKISVLGILMAPTFRKDQAGQMPLAIFRQLESEKSPTSIINRVNTANPPVHLTAELYEFFNGTISFDQQMEQRLIVTIVKFIKKALELMAPEVEYQLALRESWAKGHRSHDTRILVNRSQVIHRLSGLASD